MKNETTPEAVRGLHLNPPDLEIDQIILADVQVCVTDSDGETEAVRPWISAVMDLSSRKIVHVDVSTEPISAPVPCSSNVPGRVERWFRRLTRDLKSELGFGSHPVAPDDLPTLSELRRWVSHYAARRSNHRR